MTTPRRFASRLVEGIARRRGRPISAEVLAFPTIVFAPHQDDETLGCGGLIALKRQLGIPVKVVFMTDGSSSHDNYVRAEDLAHMRRAEAVEACRELGVPGQDVVFLDFPDGKLNNHLPEAVAATASHLSVEEASHILLPYSGDTTADHIFTRQVVLEALRQTNVNDGCVVHEYPVWFWYHWPWVKPKTESRRQQPRVIWRGLQAIWHRLVDLTEFVEVSEVLGHKKKALAAHQSQMQRPPEHPQWPVLSDVADGQWLAVFFESREYFHRCRY